MKYNTLLKNIDLNNISSKKIEALPLAVSTKYAGRSIKNYLLQEEAGKRYDQVSINQAQTLNEASQSKKSKYVYCISLSNIVKQIDEYHAGPLHIKIDVDGSEEDVCQSLFDQKLINRVSSLQIKLNFSLASHEQLAKKLTSAGYYYSMDQLNRSIKNTGPFKGLRKLFLEDLSITAAQLI